ncbi:MAG: NAD+ synthase [Thermomicrobiales bacterium]
MSLADEIAGWIRGEIEGAGLSGAVIGLSGGIDSAVASGLCARAVGPENVVGIAMPAHSSPEDVQDARLAADTWGIEYREIDLGRMFDLFIELLPDGSQLANANLKPRLRMMTLYHVANTLDYMVVGTGNRSELQVGYYTKYGDGGVDLLPLGSLLKVQVRELARDMGVPARIIDRPPSAGLWEGQTDETELGITYEQLDGALEAIAAGDTSNIDPTVLHRVTSLHRSSEHKRKLPPIFVPSR